MQKSFIERIFPHPSSSSSSFLPQHESRSPPINPSTLPRDSPRIHLPSRDASTSNSPGSARASAHTPTSTQKIQPAPLSASVIHHTDPFLPIDRASRALQQHIQQLLDAQSDGLSEGLDSGTNLDDIASSGSATPTLSIPSVFNPRSTAQSGPKTVPIRQPSQPKLSLRAARRGLIRSLRQLTQLKDQELHVITSQSQLRHDALAQASSLSSQQTSLQDSIDSMQGEFGTESAGSLRDEASVLEREILQLEERLSVMRSRHRHLLQRAEIAENKTESELSSYKNSLNLVKGQVKDFLRHPPVTHPMADLGDKGGMYALKPERRTLEMATEQWTNEEQVLRVSQRDAKAERKALWEGERLWRDVVKRVTAFEGELAQQLEILDSDRPQNGERDELGKIGSSRKDHAEHEPDASMRHVLEKLTVLIASLEIDLDRAEQNRWNLLVCCIGAELEACRQARCMLEETSNVPYTPRMLDSGEGSQLGRGHEDELVSYMNAPNDGDGSEGTRSPGESSKSLENTLEEFRGPGNQGLQDHMFDRGDGKEAGINRVYDQGTPASARAQVRYESEDEDAPGPDFLIQHEHGWRRS